MQRTPSKYANGHADLRQHFQNYFELLLSTERSKLQQTIANIGAQAEQHDILIEIECRINYLRGAVRMGKLLCLIDQEEAKTSLGLLSSERERLRACVLDHRENSQASDANCSAARLALIRQSLQPAG